MMYTFGKESLQLQERLRHFMNDNIYPNEELYAQQIEKAEDRFAPIPLMDEHGADAVRWFMLASGSPWQARRVGHAAIADVVRR